MTSDYSSEAFSSISPFSVLSFLTSKCPLLRVAASLASLNPYSFPSALGPIGPLTREPECSLNYTNLSPSLSCREAWDGALLLLENPRSQYGTATWWLMPLQTTLSARLLAHCCAHTDFSVPQKPHSLSRLSIFTGSSFICSRNIHCSRSDCGAYGCSF